MRFSIQRAAGVATAALWLGALPSCKPEPPDGVALLGATLFDGSGGPPLPDAAIVVRRGKIESVAARAEFQLPKRTTEVDLSGRWIIPGLIDAHVHLADWSLPRYLAWGVTTVRAVHGGLDSTLALRREVNHDLLSGPRIYTAGAMIDGLPTTYPDALGANRASDARKAVDRLVNSDVDLIKVYTRVDPRLLNAVIDEARTFNVRVTAHLGLTDAITAARAGVSSIEHLSGVPEAAANPASIYTAHYRSFFAGWTAFESRWAGLDSAALARVAKELAERKVALIPTLVLHDTYSRLDDPGILQDTTLKAVPEVEQKRWNLPDLIARAGWTTREMAAFRQSRPMQDLFLRLFRDAGGQIAAGTDAANQLLVPGYSEHRELALLVAAGLTPQEALLAATRNGAALLGVDSIGVIAPGKVADLVVLTADPLANIGNSLAIDRVMTRGRLLSSDSIRAAW